MLAVVVSKAKRFPFHARSRVLEGARGWENLWLIIDDDFLVRERTSSPVMNQLPQKCTTKQEIYCHWRHQTIEYGVTEEGAIQRKLPLSRPSELSLVTTKSHYSAFHTTDLALLEDSWPTRKTKTVKCDALTNHVDDSKCSDYNIALYCS